MARITGAEGLVRALIANGVDTVFALPGAQLDHLFNAFFDAGEKLRVIHTRHEQGAAYMAMGYAASTGRVGCCAVVPGPGVLNTTAALCTAQSRNDKLLIIAGQIPSNLIGRGMGLLHEIPDQLGILKTLTKWAGRARAPVEVPGLVGEAFRQMLSGRPGPAALEVPMDVLGQKAELADPVAAQADPRPPVDADAVAEAAKILDAAERPLIVVGSGAVHAAQEVKRLAERLQAPVIASRMGRGILDARHYLSVTQLAGHKLWAEADVALGIGTRMQTGPMLWGLDKELKILRIDIDAAEIKRFQPPALGIVGDSGDVLTELVAVLEKTGPKKASREEELLSVKARAAAEIDHLRPQIDFLDAIRAALPADGIFVDELTQVGYVGRTHYPVHQPLTYIPSGYQGTLGWSLATSLGVKAANPDKPVLSIAGDGGFMFTVQELATAVQHGLATISVVFNDGAYGNVRRGQVKDYGNRVIGSDLRNPDFLALAQSFGALGLRARTPDELGAAITRGLDDGRPTVIDVPVGELPDPWPFIQLPRVRPKA